PGAPWRPCGPVTPAMPDGPMSPRAPVSPFGPAGPAGPIAPIATLKVPFRVTALPVETCSRYVPAARAGRNPTSDVSPVPNVTPPRGIPLRNTEGAGPRLTPDT